MNVDHFIHALSNLDLIDRAITELESKLGMLQARRQMVIRERELRNKPLTPILASDSVIDDDQEQSDIQQPNTEQDRCNWPYSSNDSNGNSNDSTCNDNTIEEPPGKTVRQKVAWLLANHGPMPIPQLVKIIGCDYQTAYKAITSDPSLFQREGGKIHLTGDGRMKLVSPKE